METIGKDRDANELRNFALGGSLIKTPSPSDKKWIRVQSKKRARQSAELPDFFQEVNAIKVELQHRRDCLSILYLAEPHLRCMLRVKRTYEKLVRDTSIAEFVDVDLKNAVAERIANSTEQPRVDADKIVSNVIRAVLLYKRSGNPGKASFEKVMDSKGVPSITSVFEVEALLEFQELPIIHTKEPTVVSLIKTIQVFAVKAASGGVMCPRSKAQYILEDALLDMDVIFFSGVNGSGKFFGQIQGRKAELQEAVDKTIQGKLPRRINNVLHVFCESKKRWIQVENVKQLFDNAISLDLGAGWRALASTFHFLSNYNKLAIGDLIKFDRSRYENLDDNSLILACASFWATFGNTNRMSTINYNIYESDKLAEEATRSGDEPLPIQTANDSQRFKTLYDLAVGNESSIEEFGIEGTDAAWASLRILLVLDKDVGFEDGFLKVPVEISDRQIAFLWLPRSDKLEQCINRIHSEGFAARKRLLVVELQRIDPDFCSDDANFVFTAFAKSNVYQQQQQQRTESTSKKSGKDLRREATEREAKRTSGTYQIIQGVTQLSQDNRFNSLLKLGGSEDGKQQDLFETTAMLYTNVKTPFTPMGREEVKHEDEENKKLFSAGAVITTKGKWRSSPRAQKKDAKADPKNDAVNYGRYVGLVGFAASTYIKVIDELNQAYLGASVGEYLNKEDVKTFEEVFKFVTCESDLKESLSALANDIEILAKCTLALAKYCSTKAQIRAFVQESARGLKGKEKVLNTMKFCRLLLLLSFGDGDVSSRCGVMEVSAEDFVFTSNTPFIAFRANGEVKVRFMLDVPGGNCFSANMSRWHFIVIKIAEALWRLAGLDDIANETDFQAEFKKAKFKPKPGDDDLDDDLEDEAPSLGHQLVAISP
ncbi:hypothetical protein HDU96_000345 [Phlyctochytrium bullatum]|nr:hypothetical protein HDU96_000345 [Phlyctochytrium bullatum]